MSIFKKIFGKKSNDGSDDDQEQRGAFMPEIKVPVDEKFTINFTKNGGKFLYCVSHEEVSQSLMDIIDENNWQETPFYLFSKTLSPFCKAQNINYTHNCKESNVLFTSCEYLIAQNGSILISENQIGEMKLDQLPNNIIVYATTSQLLDSITDGLKQIKRIYKERIPGNITTLKNFKTEEETKEDFLSYGSSVKNLYLILLEDL